MLSEDSININQAIGANLRKHRLINDLSVTQMAETLGVTAQQYGKYEKGKASIKPEFLYLIAKRLETPISVFFDIESASIDEKHAKILQAKIEKEQLIKSFENIKDNEMKKKLVSFVRHLELHG